MGRPAISDDELAALLVVDEVSMPGVRLSAALSTASPCSSTKPLQSPLFADVPALNTAQAVAEKAEAEAEAESHGQGQGRQGLSRRPPPKRAAMSEAAFAKRLCEDVERLAARAQQRSKRFRCDPPPPTMKGWNRRTIYPPFKIPPMGKSEAFYRQWYKERKWECQQEQPQQPQQATHQPPFISNEPTERTVRTLRQAKGGNVAMGGKYEGCRESQRMPEPAESEGNEAARAALVCKLYNG